MPIYRLKIIFNLKFINTYLLILMTSGISAQSNHRFKPLYDADSSSCGYKNKKGEIIAKPIYSACFDYVFKKIVVVAEGSDLKCIDYQGNYLYDVFNYDNGPDYFSDGLIRFVQNGLLGYADKNGKVVIGPKYACAWPFEDGQAQVAVNCTKTLENEMMMWESEDWILIDNQGNTIPEDPEYFGE